MKLFLIASGLLLLALPAFADAPLTYSKTVVKIIPASEKQVFMEKEEAFGKESDTKKAGDSNTHDLMPVLHRVAKEFTVEVRPLSFLEQRDFIAHQPFTDKEGMMMVVEPAAVTQLKSSNLIGKSDILFVMEDGHIEKIAPDIALSELAEPLDSGKPVRAFIFLKSGMEQESDIKPRASIENDLFKPHPVILQ